MNRVGCFLALSTIVVGVFLLSASRAADTKPDAPLPETIDFNRDIRPILSDNCFTCHGFDPGARKARLRLDTFEGATNVRKNRAAIVPGDVEKSELFKRITSADELEKMPPPETGKKLSARDVALLKKWIEQKAPYAGHWSFIPPARPELPSVANSEWVKNPIDQFILARLERENLKPSPETTKEMLIRRVTFDLTGLPPTPAEIETFLSDTSPDAYERLVDRLLASPRYGERMAVDWLDASRFADTHGYHIDSGRDMTRWREWVINAFNTNKPFNEFTVEQLAGDLLPSATLDQKIASGFNRNHMINFEGGAIPEEYHTAYIIDRVSTTSTVWLGLTMACVQCHDHKYDPITMKDFYGLYAMFNNVPENGLDGRNGNAAPFIKAPSSDQRRMLEGYSSRIKKLEEEVQSPNAEADASQSQWEASAAEQVRVKWLALDPVDFASAGGAILARRADGSLYASGTNPDTETYTLVFETDLAEISAIRLEALPDDAFPAKGPGRSENGNAVLTEVRVAAKAGTAAEAPLKIKAASASFSQDQFDVSKAFDGKNDTGWAIFPQAGKRHEAVFEFDKPIKTTGRVYLTVTLEFKSVFPKHQFGAVRISATDSASPHGPKDIPRPVIAALLAPASERTDAQKQELRKFYRSTQAPQFAAQREEIAKLVKSRKALDDSIPTVMVMQEMEKPRETHILVRGQYDKKGEKVAPTMPAFLPQPSKEVPNNRLGLAKWLVSGDHPLVSRVIVNRYWQLYFGTGIVKTSEDFGSQGEWPSHPELLDYLATEFVKSGWNVKAMQRLIVTSAVYRQSSAVTKELYGRDPENRLLARGPRFRLQAEFIRDQALAVSGLLNGEIGGKSVSPYQPAGIWEELAYRADGDNFTAQKYEQSKGKDLYRRTMYTFWKRTAPPPTLYTFDAPDRETCTVRRARTNTPLQALILMNDPTYVEAARKLAERMILEGGAAPEERITFAFRLITARKPSANEIIVLKKVLDEQLADYKGDPESAKKLLAVGESPRNEKLDPVELASWSIVASTILNTDEAVTKN